MPGLTLSQRSRGGRRTLRSGIAAASAFLTLVGGALVVAPHAAAATRAESPAVHAPLANAPVALAATGRMASFDAEMISLVNGARAGAGLPRLTQAGGLTELSVWWSTKMAQGATGYELQHNPNAWTMVTQYGASNRTAWAENVAAFTASASASAVFNAYMNSPGHRANILGSAYHYIGMGTVSGSHGAYNTMEFTDKVDGAAPAPAPTTKAAPAPAPTTKAAPKPAPSTKPAPKPAPTTKVAPKPAPSTKAAASPPRTTERPTTASRGSAGSADSGASADSVAGEKSESVRAMAAPAKPVAVQERVVPVTDLQTVTIRWRARGAGLMWPV